MIEQIKCPRDIDVFNAPLLSIYQSLEQTDEEKRKQEQFKNFLESYVQQQWPVASLQVFGATASSFGLRNSSDMDFCILMDGPYYAQGQVDKRRILRKLATLLRLQNFEDVKAVTNARVPIVKCKDPVTRISCDIGVNNVLAVANTRMLRHYAQIDSRLRQLAFIVKHWAKSRDINTPYRGTLSSYAYVLMCIHFLQRRRPAVLPCLQGMRSTFERNVDGFECCYYDEVENLHGYGSDNRESIAELVWGFFEYWAYLHDYDNAVISVRTGRLLSKYEKNWHRSNDHDRHLICIEDPFETSHDVGKSVDEDNLNVLKSEFRRATELLLYDRNPSMNLFRQQIR